MYLYDSYDYQRGSNKMLHDTRPVPLEFAPLDVRRSTSPLQRMCHCPWKRGRPPRQVDSSAGQPKTARGKPPEKSETKLSTNWATPQRHGLLLIARNSINYQPSQGLSVGRVHSPEITLNFSRAYSVHRKT